MALRDALSGRIERYAMLKRCESWNGYRPMTVRRVLVTEIKKGKP